MKIGTIHWNFPQTLTMEQIFAKAAEIGYEGLELGIWDDDALLSFNSTKEQLDEIKSYGKKYNLDIYSIMSPIYAKYRFTSNNADDRAKAMEFLKKHIEIASYLGCESILVIPGFVEEDVDYEVAYNRALDAFKEIKPFAEEYKVEVGLENITNKFLLSPIELRDFIDKVGSKYVGSYFDIANTLDNGYPQHWINALGDRIVKVHVKDYYTKHRICTDFFEGDVNWPDVMKVLRESGYDGWITAEMKITPFHPEHSLVNTYNAMKELIKY